MPHTPDEKNLHINKKKYEAMVKEVFKEIQNLIVLFSKRFKIKMQNP